MNDYLFSILLGVVEGVTEFLPVSSTAHLRIVEALLHVDLQDSFWKMYTIVIQLGAILALPVYFWRRILDFLATFPYVPSLKNEIGGSPTEDRAEPVHAPTPADNPPLMEVPYMSELSRQFDGADSRPFTTGTSKCSVSSGRMTGCVVGHLDAFRPAEE